MGYEALRGVDEGVRIHVGFSLNATAASPACSAVPGNYCTGSSADGINSKISKQWTFRVELRRGQRLRLRGGEMFQLCSAGARQPLLPLLVPPRSGTSKAQCFTI